MSRAPKRTPQPPENVYATLRRNEVVIYVEKDSGLVGNANCGSDQETKKKKKVKMNEYGLCDCYPVYIPYTLDRSTGVGFLVSRFRLKYTKF